MGNSTDLATAAKRALIADLLSVEALPASPTQQGLWVLSQLEPSSAAYHVPVGIRFKGPLRTDVLERSFQAIVARHDSLRTTFELQGALLVQRVSPASSVSLNVEDLSGIPEAQIEIEAYTRAAQEAARPMDLNRGPLCRAKLFKLRLNEHVFLCTLHHIVSDAWSAGVLVRELEHNYEMFLKQAGYRPEPLPLQYADFAIWQREYLQTDIFKRQLAYWKTKLGESTAILNLPLDRSRPAGVSSKGWSQTVLLDSALVDRLRSIAQDREATFFILMLAAFKVLLYRYTGQTDIRVGVPVAGRNQVETEPLIGLFVNTLVLRTDLSGNPTFSAVLAQVRNAMLEALANQDVPFDKVVEELRPARSLSHNPVFQVMFATFQAAVRSQPCGDLVASPYVVIPATSRLDLSAALVEGTGGHWWIQLEYNTLLFDHDSIGRFLGHYVQLLRCVAGIDS